MAKKKSKEELDIDDSLDLNDEEESSGGKSGDAHSGIECGR